MENLLNDMLDPRKQNDAFNALVLTIKTPQGINEFHTQLKSNNRIAFLFLKSVTSQAILENDTVVLEILLQDIRTYIELVYSIHESNMAQLLVFFETLSLQNYLSANFFSFLQGQIIQYSSNEDVLPKMLRILNVSTKKYTTQTRSNALYTEINQNVELFGNIIYSLLKQGVMSGEILDILYNFLYQDIPTFFEEKSGNINTILNNLLLSNNPDITEKTCNVLTLFVLKYPECADTNAIMTNLCNLLSLKREYEITDLEKHLFCSIIRKKEVGILAANIDQIIPILYKMCYFSFDCESLDYTRKTQSVEKDVFRGNIAETIGIIDKLFNPDYAAYNFKEDEAFVFFCTVLGKKQEIAISRIFYNGINDEFVLTAVVRYLLIHKIGVNDFNNFYKALPEYNFAFFYIVAYYSFLSKNRIHNHHDHKLAEIIVNYDANTNDEIRSEYIYQAISQIGNGTCVPTEIEVYLYNQFKNYKSFTIYDSYFKIFDSLAFCIKNNKMCKEIYLVIQDIFRTSSEELYPLATQLLAILVKQSIYTTEIQAIFNTESFWMSKEMLTPLSLLAISLYEKKYIDTALLKQLCEFLILKDTFTAYLLLENLKFDNDEEYFTFAMFVASKKISYDGLLILLSKIKLDNEKFAMAVNKCLDELLRSVVGKKNLNRLKKACVMLKQRTDKQTNDKIDSLLLRNLQREGHFENVLETAVKTFDI